MTRLGRRIEIRGVVQGVGFRPWVYRLATEAGVTGRVCNTAAGVTIDAFGSADMLDTFLRRLTSDTPDVVEIGDLQAQSITAEHLDAFSIVESAHGTDHRVSIPPDLATCPACLREIFDPTNRRYGYAFTNCTACGPRFSISRDIPYDRPATTMAAFGMCEACEEEYARVADRRFHAQPNACPVCGPTLSLVTAQGAATGSHDPIVDAAAALQVGSIVALKGLGGYHLSCDATDAEVVARLRARKRRDEKPFAVMVRDLDQARSVAELTGAEEQMLAAVERPIVLVRRREPSGLAANVAPRNPLVGLLLPYTPLHHLLLAHVRRPLVMTSGNISEEPLVYRDEEAVARLGTIADLMLMHNREIAAPCDDSVARVVASRPTILRRARGYVPRSLDVPTTFRVPVLACGGLLKNTFCLGRGSAAWLGPHIGDLEHVETYHAFERSIARMERFLRVTPEIVAHDLHPDYMSTRYALARPESTKVAVQHHHAHVASLMAEHGLRGPVFGVAYDGTGYGTDGTAWGGELMVAWYDRFQRIATLRPVPLAGGDMAIRQPWRIALALLEDAFDGHPPIDAIPVFSEIQTATLAAVRQMLATGLRCPSAHGAGRYFDGVGALVLGRHSSRYEGQIAMEWNGLAEPSEDRCYPYDIAFQSSPWTIDLRPMIRDIVGDLRTGCPPSTISGRFHNTLVAATANAVRAAAREHGRLPVLLTGGCFQNPRLAESLVADLGAQFSVHLHRRVPPGDGGLSLGQAVVAAMTV